MWTAPLNFEDLDNGQRWDEDGWNAAQVLLEGTALVAATVSAKEMNKFWRLIIKIRNLSYHWSVKQYGEEEAASETKVKVMGFISGYVTTIIFIFFQVTFYLFENVVLPVGKTDPWWMKLLAGSVIFLLPVYLLGSYFLKKIEHVPISQMGNNNEYRRDLWLFWAGFLFGWLLSILIGILLMSYLRGQEINIFNIHLNKDRHIRTFEEDFGW